MATTYNISDVPGLQDAFLDAMTSDPIHARQFVAQVTKDPIPFVKNRLPYEITSDVKNNRNYENTKRSIEFLKNAGLSETDLQSVYESSVSEAKNLLAAQSGGGGFFGSDFIGAALPIAAAYFLPGAGALLATELGVSSAVGTALASVALQTAQGADLDTAVKNATVNAIVQTGSTDIAKDINAAIKDPAVTNAITSVGASVVKTAALGGNADDILKNAGAALAGSGVSTATDDKVLGSAAAGAITGGTTGAALGAAGALGAEAAKTPPTTVSEAPPTGVQLAQADTGVVSDTGEPAFRVEAAGKPIYKESPEAATYKPVSGYRLLSTSEVDNKPEGSFYDVTTNAWLAPDTTVPYEPAVIDGLSLIQATGGGGRSGFISPNAPAGIGSTGLGITDQPGAGGAGTGRGVSGASRGSAVSGEPISDMGEVTVTAEREPLITDSEKETPAGKDKEPLYSPELFIFGGRSGGGGPLSRALGTTLQAPGGTPTATTGLTSYRAPGEIEGEAGIERENVWNEASLRLKDALGL